MSNLNLLKVSTIGAKKKVNKKKTFNNAQTDLRNRVTTLNQTRITTRSSVDSMFSFNASVLLSPAISI